MEFFGNLSENKNIYNGSIAFSRSLTSPWSLFNDLTNTSMALTWSCSLRMTIMPLYRGLCLYRFKNILTVFWIRMILGHTVRSCWPSYWQKVRPRSIYNWLILPFLGGMRDVFAQTVFFLQGITESLVCITAPYRLAFANSLVNVRHIHILNKLNQLKIQYPYLLGFFRVLSAVLVTEE